MPNTAEFNESLQRYKLALGDVVFSWNTLQEALGFLFSVVSGLGPNMGFAIWNSINNDHAQRQLISGAVEGRGDEFWNAKAGTAKSDLTWLVNKCKR